MKETDVERIGKVVEGGSSFLITSHINPDGDSIGSQLALASVLERMDKKVYVKNEDPIAKPYGFLSGSERLMGRGDSSCNSTASCNVTFVLDCSSLERVGEDIHRFVKGADCIVNIDHHPDNRMFGSLNYVDIGASSVGEILALLFEKLGYGIDGKEATALYTAILTDTGSFQHSNITAKTFGVAAKLIKMGAKVSEVTSHIYYANSARSVKLLGKVLATLEVSMRGRVASICLEERVWSKARHAYGGQAGVEMGELERFVNHALSIESAEVALFFKELKRGEVSVSLRSKGVDVMGVAEEFGGGGHICAAGFALKEPLKKVKEKVLKVLSQKMMEKR